MMDSGQRVRARPVGAGLVVLLIAIWSGTATESGAQTLGRWASEISYNPVDEVESSLAELVDVWKDTLVRIGPVRDVDGAAFTTYCVAHVFTEWGEGYEDRGLYERRRDGTRGWSPNIAGAVSGRLAHGLRRYVMVRAGVQEIMDNIGRFVANADALGAAVNDVLDEQSERPNVPWYERWNVPWMSQHNPWIEGFVLRSNLCFDAAVVERVLGGVAFDEEEAQDVALAGRERVQVTTDGGLGTVTSASTVRSRRMTLAEYLEQAPRLYR
jgi:hypothetical protein